jgi:hypothetical protein
MPLRYEEAPESSAELLDDARRRLVRIKVLIDAAEHSLNANRGLEIDRDDMLELFGVLAEQADAIRLPASVEPAPAATGAATPANA